MARPGVLVARPVPSEVRRAASDRFEAVLADRNMTADEVLRMLEQRDLQGLVMGGNLTLDAATVSALPKSLKVVATTSVGTDHIDLPAAAKRGLTVTNVPDVGLKCTADLTMLHILAACRRYPEYDADMRRGWGRKYGFDEMLGLRIGGRRLGIVGGGRIGQLVATRAAAFGMELHYTDLAPVPGIDALGGKFHPDIDSLLPWAQVLTLHLPGLPGTRGLLSAERIAALPDGAVVVNAARGSLIDCDALLAALKAGKLAAAGLDTFPDEPHIDPELAALPNVTLTPHMGNATHGSRVDVCLRCLDNVSAVLGGGPAINPVALQPV